MKQIRFYLGLILGFLIYILYGRYLLTIKMNTNKVLSIYFHNPSIKVFEDVIKWLIKNNYKIIDINQFKESIDNKISINQRSAIISFDDGWIDNFDNVIPIVNKYKIPIIIFLAIDPMKVGNLWTNYVRKTYSLFTKDESQGILLKDIKRLPYVKSQEFYELAKSKKVLKRNIIGVSDIFKYGDLVSFGSHTMSHPILTMCSKNEVFKEVEDSFNYFANHNINVNCCFAYPNGDFSKDTIEVLKHTSCLYAFTTDSRIINLAEFDNNYAIPRICIPNNTSQYENLARMSSLWSKVVKIAKC